MGTYIETRLQADRIISFFNRLYMNIHLRWSNIVWNWVKEIDVIHVVICSFHLTLSTFITGMFGHSIKTTTNNKQGFVAANCFVASPGVGVTNTWIALTKTFFRMLYHDWLMLISQVHTRPRKHLQITTKNSAKRFLLKPYSVSNANSSFTVIAQQTPLLSRWICFNEIYCITADNLWTLKVCVEDMLKPGNGTYELRDHCLDKKRLIFFNRYNKGLI